MQVGTQEARKGHLNLADVGAVLEALVWECVVEPNPDCSGQSARPVLQEGASLSGASISQLSLRLTWANV